MEKRLLLAVVLMTAAIMFTNLLFPAPAPGPAPAPVEPPATPEVATEAPAPPTLETSRPTIGIPDRAVAADSVVVTSDLYTFVLSSRGATVQKAFLTEYSSYHDPEGVVQLVPEGAAFLESRLVIGSDTVDLSGLPFEVSTSHLPVTEEGGPASVDFRYQAESGIGVGIRYTFQPGTYVVLVEGIVEGAGGRPTQVLTSLGPRLEMHEHPDHNSENEFAVVTRTSSGGVDRRPLRSIEGQEVVGPGVTWAGIKDKYFLAAMIAGEERPFERSIAQELPPVTVAENGETIEAPEVRLTAVAPTAGDGGFAYSAYFGPQEFERLSAIGYEVEDVTPYGYRWLQPVIRPLAAAVLWVLNTLHNTLGVAYGWVLVVFGVMMRILLWPLNAKAMRAQMKNMGVQPLLQELREKYKNDPQKQQEAMVALYKEHGFNPFAGCVPMLVPFPVLITLFFVFQNTIAFRGAGFLWLPDLSLRDPLYVLPLILVVSMFGLQWVSAHLSGMEQNPQMKMMMYFMPVMMGAIFFMLPAGLNLYYAVTQVASIPQQVLIAKERRKAQEEVKAKGPKKKKAGR
ncbi:MAG: membrane protein insertase YidC [Gemmatimonas sp.]|nr:membrane protein insertase YidC [Gemmatimonas sp.]